MILAFKQQFVQPIIEGTKIHTFREDPHDRWKPGRFIQMATGVRTKKYNCFKETTCISTQSVKIINHPSSVIMTIDEGYIFHWSEIIEIAKNDGFEKPYDFVDFFFPKNKYGEWNGKIIHWTEKRYDYGRK